MPVSNLYIFFGKIFIQVFWPFFNRGVCFLILSSLSCSYSLDVNPLLIITFANIFSHLVGPLFVFSVVSFAVQKLPSLIRSRLFIFAFIYFFALGDRSQKILLQFMSKSVLPMFSSRSVMVSCLTFRSLIHFEFIFVYGMSKCSNLSFMCSCPVFPTQLIEETVFSPLYTLASVVLD